MLLRNFLKSRAGKLYTLCNVAHIMSRLLYLFFSAIVGWTMMGTPNSFCPLKLIACRARQYHDFGKVTMSYRYKIQ